MKNLVQIIQLMGLFTLLGVSACHRGVCFIDDAVPKLPYKVQGACDASINSYLHQLNKNGVKVITMGQSYLISIPACYLFEDETPQLRLTSYGLLNEISCFLKQFRKIEVNILSYSSKYVCVQREHALTLARSRVVGEYLWSQGIDSRFIFTHGLGSDKPIVNTLLGGDKSANARVEILFKRAVA